MNAAVGDLVLVEWVDIMGRAEWQHQGEALTWATTTDDLHKSAGFLLEAPEGLVVLAQSVARGDGQVMHVMRFPAGCVRRVVPLVPLAGVDPEEPHAATAAD